MSDFSFAKKYSQIEVDSPDKHIARVWLNNPDQHNAITMEMIEGIEEALKQIELMPEIHVVILAARGKSFCAGGDVKAMRDQSGMFAGDSPELMWRYQNGIQRIPLAIERFKKPLIAAVHGPAIGAGCDLAAMCDIRIGGERAKMGETFVKLGLVPGDGGTFFLSRVVGYAKAMEMSLTGRVYTSHECLNMGLLNSLIEGEDENIHKAAIDLALEISKNSPLALRLTKSALKSARMSDLESQLDQLSAFQGMAQRNPDHFSRLP